MKLNALGGFYRQQSLVIAALGFALILSACISVTPTIPKQDVDQAWKHRSAYLYQQNHWSAHMILIGVTAQEKFKTRAVWEQKGRDYTIKLRDFIGRTVAVIEGSAQGVVAKTSKGKIYQGENAEQLIQQLFAINIPISGMRYWLLGLPKPKIEVTQLDLNQAGMAKQISQQGWLMTYPYYLDNAPIRMPSKIELVFEDIDLTVKVSQWSFESQ